jgi:hypothetical protein
MEDVIQDGPIRYDRGALHSLRSFHSGSPEGILAQFVASQAGFEPAALRLTAVCSTSELLRRCGAASLLHVGFNFNYLKTIFSTILISLQI